MKRCASCGAEVGNSVKKCPRCGGKIWQKQEDPVKDYWAEKLSEAPEDDWLKEVDDKDLPDINEDREKTVENLKTLKPAPASKAGWILVLFCLAGIALTVIGFRYMRDQNRQWEAKAGMYYGCTRSSGGTTEKNKDDWLELFSDGTFRIRLDGKRENGKWKLEAEKFQGLLGNRKLDGTLSDGILSFHTGNTEYVFAMEPKVNSVLEKELAVAVTVPTEENRYGQWAGDYYGSMVISEGTGMFAGSAGEACDVCGRIQLEEEDRGRLSLWNEQNKPGDRFCMADVILTEGTTEMGKLYAEWGTFYDMEIGPGEWVIDPGKSPVSHLEDLIYFRGTYMDMSHPDSSFVYEIFLKPWGKNWENVKQFCQDPWMLPPHYDDWYLPLQSAGIQMPDHF